MSGPQTICDLAGIRFTFSPLALDSLSPYFKLFSSRGGAVSDRCSIRLAGANSELCDLQGKGAWQFSMRDGCACLMGANPRGDVLWRMTGKSPYGHLRFEWHPTAYEAMYHNEELGMYGIVAILALVLRLLPLGGLVIHGSSQVVDGHGVICTGPHGRGKTTVSRLFNQCGIPVLTDERPIVRPCDRSGQEAFRVYGSPWPSLGRFVRNDSVFLKKIYFLEHGPEQEILPLTTREAVMRLLEVTMVPWMDAAFFDPLIKTMEAVIRSVPHAVLRFRPDITVVDAVRRDLAASPFH